MSQNLALISARDRWYEHTKAVELAWTLLHDAKDRITKYGGLELDSDFVSFCETFWKPVEKAISDHYGPGVYTSWEVVLDGLTCSICQSDVRGCEHVPGRWYDDKLCQAHAEGGYIAAVALVENPRDPRCRIWPWKRKESEEDGNTIMENIPIYIIFDPDGKDDGGIAVNADAICSD